MEATGDCVFDNNNLYDNYDWDLWAKDYISRLLRVVTTTMMAVIVIVPKVLWVIMCSDGAEGRG